MFSCLGRHRAKRCAMMQSIQIHAVHGASVPRKQAGMAGTGNIQLAVYSDYSCCRAYKDHRDQSQRGPLGEDHEMRAKVDNLETPQRVSRGSQEEPQ